MLYSMTAKIADPVLRAKTAFTMWSAINRMADSGIRIALLRKDLDDRLLRLREARAERIGLIRLAKRLAWFDCDGFVHVIVDSMDCDCARSVTCRKVSSDPVAFVDWLDDLYENAEGRTSYRIISDEEAEEFTPSYRDLALEAYEDGHPHVVYA